MYVGAAIERLPPEFIHDQVQDATTEWLRLVEQVVATSRHVHELPLGKRFPHPPLPIVNIDHGIELGIENERCLRSGRSILSSSAPLLKRLGPLDRNTAKLKGIRFELGNVIGI